MLQWKYKEKGNMMTKRLQLLIHYRRLGYSQLDAEKLTTKAINKINQKKG